MGAGSGDDASATVEHAAREAHDSTAVEALARAGIAGRGLVWLVVALLTGSVLRGGAARTDKDGALAAIAARPFGAALLVVLACGFAGYALSLALDAAVGHRGEESRTRQRVGSAGKAVVHLALAGSVARFLAGAGSGGDPAPGLTARLMQAPGGRWLVGLAGLSVVAVGVVLGVRALRGTHDRRIDRSRVPGDHGEAALRVGVVGLVGRGLLVVLLSGFVVGAAVHADPREAKGLDAALHTLARQPYGRGLLVLALGCLVAYAAWSFVEAALHDGG